MSLNVNRSVTDQFYRYKMPRLIAKVEGKGNGIKTVIVNMVDVAKALGRPPTYPCKYFGCELGAQTQFDTKNERYIVNGAHDGNRLQDMLDGFIRRYILCNECENPETTLIVKRGQIGMRCAACGYQGLADNQHKLATFIQKNPPETYGSSYSAGGSGGGASSGKKDGKKGGKRGKRQENGDGNPDRDRDSPDKGEGEVVGDILVPDKIEEGTNDDWFVDTSLEAINQRMGQLSEGAKGLMLNNDLEKTTEERINLFYGFVKGKKESGSLAGADREILAEAERLDIKDKGPLVLAELLFDESILTQIKEYKKHFLRFVHGNKKAQKSLLGAFELLVGKMHSASLMPKVPHILKTLYDADLLEEEVILQWGQKVSKKYVSKEKSQQIHDKASPFLKWLQEAEEESSEEDEEDVEVVYSSAAVSDKLKMESQPKPSQTTAEQSPQQQEEDDFNIDDI